MWVLGGQIRKGVASWVFMGKVCYLDLGMTVGIAVGK